MVSTSFRPLRQLAEAERFARRGVRHLAAGCLERAAIDAPLLGRQAQQQRPRRGGGPAHLRDHGRRGPAAEGPHVEGNVIRVAHHQLHRFHRQVQLVGHGHGQRGAGVLADLDLAGRGRHGAILADVQPGVDLARELARRPGAGRRTPALALPGSCAWSSCPRQSTSRPPPRIRRKSRRPRSKSQPDSRSSYRSGSSSSSSS